MDLLTLQGSIKQDPEGYQDEFELQYRHYKACLAVFSLKPSQNDDRFAELVTFVSQVSYCYPQLTSDFPSTLCALLDSQSDQLDPALRVTLVKAVILLRHRGQLSPLTTLPLFFKLFRCPDKTLRQHLFKHIVADIKSSNKKGRNDKLNRALQNFLYGMLADENTTAAKKSLAVLSEMYRRGVWRDAKTVNVISSALFHKSPQVMVSAIKFFLGQDEKEEDKEEGEEEGDKPEGPSKADVYKAYHKGTISSKRKKQAKLKRVVASVKKSTKAANSTTHEAFAALQLLHDPQSLCEKLFSRVQSGRERYETRLLMMTLLCRIVGMHKVLLINLYPYLQKYIAPHQKEVPTVLAALAQCCHDVVPPDVLAPVLRQLCDQFVNDTARPEVMTLGLKTVREVCLRAPLVMTPELLQDLVGYKKFKNKSVSSAARSLMGLFREIAPGMLEKRDRGRGADMEAAPRAYGETAVRTRVEGAELLEEAMQVGEGDGSGDDDDNEGGDDGDISLHSDDDGDDVASHEGGSVGEEDGDEEEGDAKEGDAEEEGEVEEVSEGDDDVEEGSEDDVLSDDEVIVSEDADDVIIDEGDGGEGDDDVVVEERKRRSKEASSSTATAPKKVPAMQGSMSSLKKQLAEAAARKGAVSVPGDEFADMPIEYGRILTEEDFERIRELRHRKLVDAALKKHGLKSTTAKRDKIIAAAEEEADEMMAFQDGLGVVYEKRVAATDLEANMKHRRDKAERLASVLKGREGREEFGAAAKRKKAKAGGLSNREKQKRKSLPLAAKQVQIAMRNKRKKQGGGKGAFKGRVAKRFRNC